VDSLSSTNAWLRARNQTSADSARFDSRTTSQGDVPRVAGAGALMVEQRWGPRWLSSRSESLSTPARLSLDADAIPRQVSDAAAELSAEAQSVRLVATALETTLLELFASASADELRQSAAVVKAHAKSMLSAAATLLGKAERLETLADLREAAELPVNDQTE
jgi:hypothetical protein